MSTVMAETIPASLAGKRIAITGSTGFVGTALVAAAERRARADGRRCITLTTGAANERALRFYRDGLGLRPLFDVRLDGPGLDAVTGTPGARGRMIGLLVPGAGKVSIAQWLIHDFLKRNGVDVPD